MKRTANNMKLIVVLSLGLLVAAVKDAVASTESEPGTPALLGVQKVQKVQVAQVRISPMPRVHCAASGHPLCYKRCRAHGFRAGYCEEDMKTKLCMCVR